MTVSSQPWSDLRATLLVVLPLLAFLVACGVRGETVAGEVDHKVVTGVSDGVAHTILIYRLDDQGAPTIFLKDPDIADRISTDGTGVRIGDALALEIESRYDKVDYYINVRLDSDSGPRTQPYRTTRDIFNGMRVGTRVRFEAKGGDTPSITKWLDRP